MKVVIDINEHYYEILKYDVEHGNDYKPIVLIANGTPLPKGHGDLVDVEKLYDEMYDIEVNGVSRSVVNHETILNARKIIHADKESKEPKQILKNCENCGYPYKLAGKCYSCDNYSQWIPIEADKENK